MIVPQFGAHQERFETRGDDVQAAPSDIGVVLFASR